MESVQSRQQLKALAETLEGEKLEISPSMAPILDHARADVRSAAVLTREEQCEHLRRDPNVANSLCRRVPETDYILQGKDAFSIKAATGEARFVLVVSSHTLEHTTSLVGHLNDVHAVLAPGGSYVGWVPDCRYCFDRDRFPTTIADVIEDFYLNGARHKLSSVLGSRIYHASNDPSLHWRSPMQTREGMTDQSVAVAKQKVASNELTREEIDRLVSSEEYVDCHNYRLTPKVFRNMFEMLRDLEYLPQDLVLAALHPTGRGSHEFSFCIKRKPA